jgi:hypothetical protein
MAWIFLKLKFLDIFNILDFDLNVELVELHTIFHLQMLNIIMMIIWCI